MNIIKTFEFFIIGATLGASLPCFAQAKLLLSKTNYPGYTRADIARQESCSIYANLVVIERRYGLAVIGERRPLHTSGIEMLIEEASREQPVHKPNLICDAPSSLVTAYRVNADGGNKSLVLYSTGGCGNPQITQKGFAALNLLEMINYYCPTTHH